MGGINGEIDVSLSHPMTGCRWTEFSHIFLNRNTHISCPPSPPPFPGTLGIFQSVVGVDRRLPIRPRSSTPSVQNPIQVSQSWSVLTSFMPWIMNSRKKEILCSRLRSDMIRRWATSSQRDYDYVWQRSSGTCLLIIAVRKGRIFASWNVCMCERHGGVTGSLWTRKDS